MTLMPCSRQNAGKPRLTPKIVYRSRSRWPCWRTNPRRVVLRVKNRSVSFILDSLIQAGLYMVLHHRFLIPSILIFSRTWNCSDLSRNSILKSWKSCLLIDQLLASMIFCCPFPPHQSLLHSPFPHRSSLVFESHPDCSTMILIL